MRERTKRRTHLLLAVAAALVSAALVTLPAAAGDMNVDETVTPEQRSTDIIVSSVDQFDDGGARLDKRMHLYFGAASEEAFAAALTGASTPLTFRGGRGLWTPLVTLDPIQGLFFGVGAGRASTIRRIWRFLSMETATATAR